MAKIDEPRVTPERLMQFGFAYAPPLIIRRGGKQQSVLIRLRVDQGLLRKSAPETGASIRGLRAIMNALVGLELLTKSGDKYSPHAGE